MVQINSSAFSSDSGISPQDLLKKYAHATLGTRSEVVVGRSVHPVCFSGYVTEPAMGIGPPTPPPPTTTTG